MNRGFYICNIHYNNINNPNFKAIFTIALFSVNKGPHVELLTVPCCYFYAQGNHFRRFFYVKQT